MQTSPQRKILAAVPRGLRNAVSLRHLAIDALWWVGLLTGHHLVSHWSMTLALAVGFAFFGFRAFGMMHECVHSSGFSSRKWNNILGSFYGVFCFLPFKSWQDLHLNHHTWTGNVERDPSTRLIYQFKRNDYQIAGYVAWAWRNWMPVLAFLQHLVFWKAVRTRSEVFFVLSSVAYLGISAYLLGPAAVLVGLFVYLCMVEIINFPHHLGMELHEGEERFLASEQARFTRSCIYPKWFAHLVLLNFNLHTEHHLFPAHPWYQLDAVHEQIKDGELLKNSCVANAWILENRVKPIEEILRQSFKKEKADAA